jgi:hypothetical protein
MTEYLYNQVVEKIKCWKGGVFGMIKCLER